MGSVSPRRAAPIASMACSGVVPRKEARSPARPVSRVANFARGGPVSPADLPKVANVSAASNACFWEIPNPLSAPLANLATSPAAPPKICWVADTASCRPAAAPTQSLIWSTAKAAPMAAPTPFAHVFSFPPVPSTLAASFCSFDESAKNSTTMSRLPAIGLAAPGPGFGLLAAGDPVLFDENSVHFGDQADREGHDVAGVEGPGAGDDSGPMPLPPPGASPGPAAVSRSKLTSGRGSVFW